jgi:hypothetical protein
MFTSYFFFFSMLQVFLQAFTCQCTAFDKQCNEIAFFYFSLPVISASRFLEVFFLPSPSNQF